MFPCGQLDWSLSLSYHCVKAVSKLAVLLCVIRFSGRCIESSHIHSGTSKKRARANDAKISSELGSFFFLSQLDIALEYCSSIRLFNNCTADVLSHLVPKVQKLSWTCLNSPVPYNCTLTAKTQANVLLRYHNSADSRNCRLCSLRIIKVCRCSAR